MNRIIPIAIVLASFAARAYQPGVHAELAKEAARVSNMTFTLRDRLGEALALDTVVNGRSLRGWIGYGAYEEDDPGARCVNHFHDPLESWPNAGIFNVPGVPNVNVSSIYWQQANHRQPLFGGGDWSWPTLRAKYRTYLLSTNANERNNALADLMRGIGQLSHLVQDATSPPHTRSDKHYLIDGYETWTDALRSVNPSLFSVILHSTPVRPDPNIFQATNDSSAPSRIARLIDDDIYAGDARTYNTSGLMGASEYTNGGYVSDDTVFLGFAMPRTDALDNTPLLDTTFDGTSQRFYFSKIGDGDSIKHFVAEGTLWERLQFSLAFASYVLDDNTYTDAAFKLMPRAVGYSAALFDYFFRDQLEVTAPDRYVFGAAAYNPADPQYGTFRQIKARVRRKPGSDEDLGSGTLTAVVRYRYLDGSKGVPFTNSFEEPFAPMRAAWEQSVSKPIAVPAVLGTAVEWTFDFSDSQIPVNAVDVRLVVVFQGHVGAESDAIAIGAHDLAEPDPVDFVDGSDWECFNGQLYNIADSTLFPNAASRDLDHNGTPDLFGPFVDTGVHFKASGLDRIFFPASESSYDMKVQSMGAGPLGPQVARAVILGDRFQYAAAIQVDRVTGFFGTVGQSPGLAGWFTVLNATVTNSSGGLSILTTCNSITCGNRPYRGKIGYHEFVLVSEKTAPCLGLTVDKKPDATNFIAPPAEVNP